MTNKQIFQVTTPTASGVDFFVETPFVTPAQSSNHNNKKKLDLTVDTSFDNTNALYSSFLASPMTDTDMEKSFYHLLNDNSASLFSPGADVPVFSPQDVGTAVDPFFVAHQVVVEQAKITAAPKKKTATAVTTTCDPKRTWTTTYVNTQVIPQGAHINVRLKTRRDQPSEAVPEKMYSSLKYVLLQSATGFSDELPFLLSRVRVVDSENFDQVKKNNKDVLKGTIEAALTKPTRAPFQKDAQFEGQLNCQFTDVSFHTDKRLFCYEIHYFVPTDLDTPVMIKRSAPYKTYARKPNKKRGGSDKKTAKRKREATSDDEDDNDDDIDAFMANIPEQEAEQPVAKKQKTEFDHFVARLDELVEFNKRLSVEERRRAMDMMLNKFVQLDPQYTCSALVPQTLPTIDPVLLSIVKHK